MKKLITCTLTTLAALAGLSTQAIAGHGKSFKDIVEPVPYFRNTEVQVDGYFNQTFARGTVGNVINTGPGGGASVNVIFARYFGIGVKNTFFNNGSRASYLLNPQAIFRLPIESAHLAPYINVGGGAGFGRNTFGFGSVGGGFEYRFTPHIGTFVDTNWLFGASNNAAVLNSGFRFAF